MNIGDVVYTYNENLGILRGKIFKLIGDLAAEIKIDCIVSYCGNEIVKTNEHIHYAEISDIYLSAKDAYNSYCEESEKKIKEYCDEIKTIKDLINFSIENCLDGCKNEAARLAYIRMATKLLSIKI